MGVPEERLERRAVPLDPVRPEVPPHEGDGLMEFLAVPRQGTYYPAELRHGLVVERRSCWEADGRAAVRRRLAIANGKNIRHRCRDGDESNTSV